MRELVYYVAVSLDGHIAGPSGEFDAFMVEGEGMDMLTREFPDAIPTDLAEQLGIDQSAGRFGTVLMGWNTYAIGPLNGMPSPYRHLEQIVFSRTHHAEEESLRTTDTPPPEVVRELKREDGGDIWLCGGGDLAGQLAGQIDRLVLKRQPLLFGDGVPLFRSFGYSPSRFDLTRTQSFDSGLVVSEYERR